MWETLSQLQHHSSDPHHIICARVRSITHVSEASAQEQQDREALVEHPRCSVHLEVTPPGQQGEGAKPGAEAGCLRMQTAYKPVEQDRRMSRISRSCPPAHPSLGSPCHPSTPGELPPKATGSWIPGFDLKHQGNESEFLLISLKTSLLFMTGNDSHQKCVAGYNLNVFSNSGNFQEDLIVNTIMCPQVTNQRSCLFTSFAQKNN